MLGMKNSEAPEYVQRIGNSKIECTKRKSIAPDRSERQDCDRMNSSITTALHY